MSQRARQVGEELRKIVSRILLEEIDDARFGFVTITRVEITADLRFARVFYSVLGPAQARADTQAALEDCGAEIRRFAVQRLNLKYATEIKFEYDESIAEGFKIDEIIRKIKREEK